MEQIYKRIAERVAHAQNHPLFDRIERIQTSDVPRYMRTWSHQFIHLGMTFRDVNRMYLAYPNPKDAFEIQINNHAEVDSTHWKFLLADLKKIGIADQVNTLEQAVTMIWSESSVAVRHYIYSLVHRAISCGQSPFLWAACMEAGEATVKAFFTAARTLARKFQDCTGHTLQYFGEDHINSEIDNPIDDQLFRVHVLPDGLASQALSLVDQHFDHFGPFLDHKYQLTIHTIGS